MANQIFRAFAIIMQGKKVAEAMSSTYDNPNGSTQAYGLEGVLGQTDGIIETKLEFDTVCPIDGHEIDFATLFLNQTRVTVGIPVDGGYDASRGIISGRSYTSDSKTGECKGKWSFIGDKPTRQ